MRVRVTVTLCDAPSWLLLRLLVRQSPRHGFTLPVSQFRLSVAETFVRVAAVAIFSLVCGATVAPELPPPEWLPLRASWYGEPFHGRLTANGEVFDKNDLTAASRTLPFGSVWTVRRGSAHVVVRINDRGPFCCPGAPRHIDLSEAAARALDLIEIGVAEVDLMRPGALW